MVKPLQQLRNNTINSNVSVWTDAHTVQCPYAMKSQFCRNAFKAKRKRKATNILERKFLSPLSVYYYIQSTGLQSFCGKRPHPLLWAGYRVEHG